jgi:VanZ family protein
MRPTSGWTRFRLWGPVIVYMAAIFHFSSESHPLPALTEHVWDKLLHTVEYVGLAVLVFRALNGEGFGAWPAAILTVALVSAYGATDEWHQLFVPPRQADLQDWMTDTLAGVIGAAGCVLFYRGDRRARRE